MKPSRYSAQRRPISLARVALLLVVCIGIAFALWPTLRGRALLTAVDLWSLADPTLLEAKTSPAPRIEASTSLRERRLLAENLRLRSELGRLMPSTAVSDRLVEIDAIEAQVIWTATDQEREAILALAELTGAAIDDLVVSDNGLDVGRHVGTEADALVLSGRSLIGRVGTVGRRSAGVTPIDSESFQVAAEIIRSSDAGTVVGAQGTFVGDGQGAGKLLYVSAELPVSVGDDVLTRDDSIWSGQRLHIGTVSKADLSPGEQHWKIEVTPSGSLRSRDRVLVLRPRIATLDATSRDNSSAERVR